MTKFKKRTNYRKKYPGLSDEIIIVLEKSDRKMEYQQYDLKVVRYQINCINQTVTFFPSREDSYERLLDENRQFAVESESLEDAAIKAVLIEKMLKCLKRLSREEHELIMDLYFRDKSEHQIARETGIPRMTIHNRKNRILEQLKNLIQE